MVANPKPDRSDRTVDDAIDHSHEQMPDKELATAYNGYRKKLIQLSVTRAVLDRQLQSAEGEIEGRECLTITGEGVAVILDGQGSLF